MSDRIAVMNRGLIEQVADPEEVYERPATTFVAGFIGVSNLMPGTVRGNKIELDSGAAIDASTEGFGAGERCQAIVRPEKLEVSHIEDSVPSDRQSVEGQVESSLYLGTATQLVVSLGGDTHMTVLVPNADEAQRQRLPGGGAQVRLSWAPEHIHVVRESNGSGPADGDLRPTEELAVGAGRSTGQDNEEESS